MAEPATREEYERRYTDSHRVSGYGIEGVTNHFPCPFCGAPEWHVVRVIDFGPPIDQQGAATSDPIECSECGRSAAYITSRDANGVTLALVQIDGPDPAPWVPITRADQSDRPTS